MWWRGERVGRGACGGRGVKRPLWTSTSAKTPVQNALGHWTKHAKAAPFKRNDAMLDTMPIGVIHFPGTGIQDNLADKARKLGTPLMKPGGGKTAAARRLYQPPILDDTADKGL